MFKRNATQYNTYRSNKSNHIIIKSSVVKNIHDTVLIVYCLFEIAPLKRII